MNLADCGAIIFDSDGVLVDSEIIHIAVEQELLAELGLHYKIETYLSRFVGLSNPDFYSQLASDYAARIGGEFPPDFGQRLQKRIEPRIEAELQPIAGVVQLVEAFAGRVAVASSAPIERLTRKLEITGLISHFTPHVYSVDHVKKGKPAPDLFLHAAEQIGVQPERCAVIEDSVNGVMAARAAGMTPIGFVGGGHADSGLRDRLLANGAMFVVSSHNEIIKLL
ncbi:HAD family hydrolase [Pontixanthobacter aquaemixtae]|uniref:HAD-IA family hydrolase n=1 Tax=Pontixanthobacter aquaemixtae TaxID=1958940 RepID=A0A844ZRI7_9SPHN|nr:HAD family hydrolase [Pontixanthobacter aquaemixtae]MXO89626.1 HAD-IA family hydrolase [Pontixanthobacter aquaemixtae]